MQQLASGTVPVRYERLPGGFRGTDETVKRMQKAAMGRYGARSPKIRALARNVLVRAGVPEKNYEAEARALAAWVRDNIRYMKDVYGQETLSYPEEVAFNMKAGDCDDLATLAAALISSVGVPTRFKVIGVSPMQYSHVYLQAQPNGGWINIDPIMKDKPIGWEVPRNKRAIEKTYPINGIEGGSNMSGLSDGNLGYVGDPRVESYLQSPTIPYGAGTGKTPARAASHPAYVKMDSMLDTDAPIDPMMAFPPNQNLPQRYPQQRAQRINPQIPRMGPDGMQGLDALEEAAYNGSEVLGPEALAGDVGKTPPDDMAVPAYMQTKTVRQAPEGVDAMFGRPQMVLDPRKGDKVEYYGRVSLAEKPPIRAYENISGLGQDDQIPPRVDPSELAPQARAARLPIILILAAGAGLLYYMTRKS